MHKVEFRIRGEGVEELPEALNELSRTDQTAYTGDGVVVLADERFSFLTGGTGQVTVVIETIDETTREGVILSGGGGDGFLALSLGTESSRADTVLDQMENYCEANGLSFEQSTAESGNELPRR